MLQAGADVSEPGTKYWQQCVVCGGLGSRLLKCHSHCPASDMDGSFCKLCTCCHCAVVFAAPGLPGYFSYIPTLHVLCSVWERRRPVTSEVYKELNVTISSSTRISCFQPMGNHEVYIKFCFIVSLKMLHFGYCSVKQKFLKPSPTEMTSVVFKRF